MATQGIDWRDLFDRAVGPLAPVVSGCRGYWWNSTMAEQWRQNRLLRIKSRDGNNTLLGFLLDEEWLFPRSKNILRVGRSFRSHSISSLRWTSSISSWTRNNLGTISLKLARCLLWVGSSWSSGGHRRLKSSKIVLIRFWYGQNFRTSRSSFGGMTMKGFGS